MAELWTYISPLPNSPTSSKARPILVIGDDSSNGLKYVDIHYILVSSSAECGKYDVLIDASKANQLGLKKESVIKTTKIFTGSRSYLGQLISDLPEELEEEFKEKYSSYQQEIISKL